MVAGRQADCVLWASSRRTLANLCGACRGRHAGTDLSQRYQPGGPELVAGREVDGVRREFAEQSGVGDLHAGFEDAKSDETAGIGWAVFATVVAGRTEYCSHYAGFAETEAL